MSHPQTHPGNVNKHPGQIVRDANKAQQRTKEQVAAEKMQKQVQKDVRVEAEKKSCTSIAVIEDAMAVQQNAQMMGLPKLVRPRPKPRMVASSKSKTNQENSAVTTQSLAEPAAEDGQTDQPVRKKHQGLKMNFRCGVAANRKVSNSGVTIATSHSASDTHVGSMIGDGKIRFSTKQKQAGVQDLKGLIPDWAEKVASEAQLKLSAPPSTHTSKTPKIADSDADLDDDDEYYEPLATQGGKDLVHLVEKPRNTSKGLKHPLPAPKEAKYDEQEEVELLNDPEAAGDGEEQYDGDMEIMVDDDGCTDQKRSKAEAIVTRHTSLMSVDISDLKIAGSLIKTEDTISDNPRTKIKKGKAKNSDLPSGALEQGQWRTTFLPSLMYWVGNSDYGWSIPENELENTLEYIFNAVCSFTHPSVLMAFFASTPEYKTQEAREEYAEDQLQDCHFVYEDPENEDQPGAFLSEYILRIFASHLSAVSGKVRVDELVEFGKPGYLTALALAAAAAERALILVQSCLLIDSDPSDSGGKNHKILQTLNKAMNKMSHTGTAFSSGNWETDTLAYMDSIKDLPHSRIQEILTRAEEYMKHPRHNRRSAAEDSSGSSLSITPANKRARLHICNFLFYFIFTC
ncbi:hypothetical protein EDB19DRAFT_1833050 [Suillus lakei]|nr:hypothetical protein EDB19DRAFT_1833050 [Suillus lakei]